MSDGEYVGSELELFKHADRWKGYIRRKLGPWLTGDVAEIGAGIGGTTSTFADLPGIASWLCVEPDPAQTATIDAMIASGELPAICSTLTGTLADLAGRTFDTIIYIDVLEHIEDDAGELELAADALKPGGRIVVLAPAYQYLFSDFDASIGHYRRYTIEALRVVAPDRLREAKSFYLDSVGLASSIANKLFLKQSMPTLGQVQMWDKLMVPVSTIADKICLHRFGRSAVVVWEKPA